MALPLWILGTGGFVKKHWKVFAGIVAAITVWWSFTTWRDNLVDAARAEGFSSAQQQYTAAIEAANERARADQTRLDQIVISFGGLASQREQDINLRIEPMIERIEREVASDPRYRECRVSDSVLDELNAGRAAVDAGIASSAARRD